VSPGNARRYVVVLGALALLTAVFLERKHISETEKVGSPAVTQPSIPVLEQSPSETQPASIAPPGGEQSSEPDAAGSQAPSSDPKSTGRSELAAPHSACSAKPDGTSTKPLSPVEVSALVQGYMLRCSDKLFSAMDEIYQQEERDETWATKLEEKIGQATGAGGARLKGVCRTSLCRLDPDTSQPGACNRSDVNHSLIMSVSGTELEGEIIYRFTPCSRFFYAQDGPPAFVEPLRQRMGDGS
jgi:hypothetical protein